jgi:signal transduction histidine kinase
LILNRLKELEERNKELEKNAISEVVHAEDKIRERIGSELHDSVGQLLTSVLISFRKIDKKIHTISGDADLIADMDRATKLLNTTINEVRAISHDLMPSVIYLFGLVDSIHDLADTLRLTSSKEISFSTNLAVKLDAFLECSVYRIVQEAVNNSLKYSSCNSISIQMMVCEDILTVVIEDDGVGFDMESVDLKRHVGLTTMKHRAVAMNGSFEVDTAPGKGVVITVEVPLKHYSK